MVRKERYTNHLSQSNALWESRDLRERRARDAFATLGWLGWVVAYAAAPRKVKRTFMVGPF